MNFIHAMNITYDIGNSAQLVHTVRILEKDAEAKGLILNYTPDLFVVYVRGQVVGNDPLLRTDNVDTLAKFIDNYGRTTLYNFVNEE